MKIEENAKRIRLKDIAIEANLSVAAVSYALKDKPGISAETVDRVKRIAKEMGYRPDPVMSALAAHRNRMRSVSDYAVVGVVSNRETERDWLEVAPTCNMMNGARSRAEDLGFRLEHFWARGPGMSEKRLSDILYARGIRGVMVAPGDHKVPPVSLNWEHFAAVSLEECIRTPGIHHVMQNQYANISLVWEKLHEREHSKVGLICYKGMKLKGNFQWEAVHSFHQSQVAPESERVPTLYVDSEDAVVEIRRWMRRYRPEVVVAPGCRFLDAALEGGFRVPRDVKYVSLNVENEPEGGISDGIKISGIRQKRDEIGAKAMEILNGLLRDCVQGVSNESVNTQITGEWIEGETL